MGVTVGHEEKIGMAQNICQSPIITNFGSGVMFIVGNNRLIATFDETSCSTENRKTDRSRPQP